MRSIRDVARLAGVSFTTVSHVLNGTRKVSESAHERVMRAVHEINYVPSALARSLRVSKTRTLGVLVPDISNPFCSEITLGIEDGARQADYSVVLGNTGQEGDQQTHQIKNMLSQRVDGLLLVAGIFDHSRLVQALAKIRMPVLLIDHEAIEMSADWLQMDQFHAALLATQHLLTLGHRRIACLSGPAFVAISQERVRGWRQGLADAGIEPESDWSREGDFSIESGYGYGMQCLPQRRVSAVLACNDMMAMGVLRAAAKLGLSVPTELSVVGIDGIEMGGYAYPALTTVGDSLKVVGKQAADMLIERIEHPNLESRRVRRSSQLILRESTGPASPLPREFPDEQ